METIWKKEAKSHVFEVQMSIYFIKISIFNFRSKRAEQKKEPEAHPLLNSRLSYHFSFKLSMQNFIDKFTEQVTITHR